MPPPRRPKKLCGSSLLISWRRPRRRRQRSPRSPPRPSAASRRSRRAARAAAPASRRPARAPSRSSASRSALDGVARGLAAGRARRRARRCVMRSRIAAVSSGSVRLRIAEDRDLGRIVLADLPRVGVEMDQLHAGRHRLDVGRQRQREQVARRPRTAGRAGRAPCARRLRARHRAAEQRMRGRERRRVRHELGIDRRADQLGQRDQLRMRAALRHRVAGDDDRALRLRQQLARRPRSRRDRRACAARRGSAPSGRCRPRS